ncbi:MAG: ABC transporter permease [Butyrivibrio sp.]|nr:ABC transporter permease [Butyrivibrio sp.]
MKKEVFEVCEKLKNKTVDFAKKSKKTLILIAILLIVDIVLGVISRILVSDMPEQDATSRWSDERCAHVSLFFTQDQNIDDHFIKTMEYNFITAVKEDGVQVEEGDYDSCYSASGVADFKYGDNSVTNVDTVGVAGDFFLFHPLNFVAGGPFYDDTDLKDHIVIDEVLAWHLFGSDDVIGEFVDVGGVPHYISGVFKRKEGKIREAAGPRDDFPVAYITYDSLSKYGKILSGRVTEQEISEDGKKARFGGINCYEIVGPNPIDKLIYNKLKDKCGLDDRFYHICENSERFKTIPLYEVIGAFGTRSMWSKAIYYPSWENVARGYEDILALLLLFRTILKAVAGIALFIILKKNYERNSIDFDALYAKLADKKYDIEVELNKRKRDKKGNDE